MTCVLTQFQIPPDQKWQGLCVIKEIREERHRWEGEGREKLTQLASCASIKTLLPRYQINLVEAFPAELIRQIGKGFWVPPLQISTDMTNINGCSF